MLSQKISAIAPSATLSLNAKAKAMRAEGKDVLNFAVGEPDFDAPENILKAAHQAIDDGYSKYTPATGLPELKEAIVNKFANDNNIEYETSQVIVGSGAKPLLLAALQSLCNPGDEVIMAAPYWVTYLELIKLVDAKPVIVQAREEDNFVLKAETIEAAITNKTKVLLINTPSNPTGSVITEDELRKIAELAENHDIYIIADEMYERLVYEGEHFSLASVSDSLKSRTITVNGASKTYAVTGWRLGYCAGPSDVIKGMGSYLSHATGNANSIAQRAIVEALNGPQKAVENMKVEFIKRRDRFHQGLNAIEGISCVKPNGAFYLFPNFSGLYNDDLKDSTAMANHLLEEANIAAVPGIAFGADNNLRFSYATSMETIEKCLERLEKLFS